MDSALIAFLLDMAVKFTGLPAIPVDALPPFQPVSRGEMQRRVCPEAAPGCGAIVALFDTEGYRILYLDSLDPQNPADNSFLVHELVHVLQFRQRGDAIYADCPALLRTEGEAYRAQNAYLKREGQLMRVGEVLRFTTCAADRAVAARATPGTSLGDPRRR
jgi:hypothetical protein